MKKRSKQLFLAIGDKVRTKDNNVHTVICVDIKGCIPYCLSNNCWYTAEGNLYTICDIPSGPIIEKLPSDSTKKQISNKQYKINLTITNEEIEIMRNCLSDLRKAGVSLNLKFANALIDAGYHK